MPIKKKKNVSLFLNDSQNVSFNKLKYQQKLGVNWLHIWGVMIVFLF